MQGIADDVLHTTAAQTRERIDFETARRRRTVAGFVEFIRRHAESRLVDAAVEGIYLVLSDEFPAHRYRASLRWEFVKSELLAALRAGRPLLIVFAPKELEDRAACDCTIHFVEIAGVRARFNDMVASIRTPHEGVWRANGNGIDRTIIVEPFGRAEHRWSCCRGTWRTGSAVLSYFGSYGTDGRFLKVHAQVNFPPSSAPRF